MTLVRERRHQQALHLSLPPPFSADFTSYDYDYECCFHRLNSSVSQVIKVSTDLEKIHVVGHGSSSSVYKVRHRKTGSVYALKVLRPDPYGGSMVNPTREAEIITNVNSDFLLTCHGVIHHAGKLCFVMEYMDYGSLHDALRAHERLPEVVISTVASRVLKGLKYLHGMQIVHNDIKPSNLLINGKGEVKIADFGLSTKVILDGPNSSQMGQGTWAYMSPERFDPERWGSSDSGFAGDVWALGVVLLECFLGQHPFIGPGQKPDWAALSCAICFEGAVELPVGVSPEFRSFLRRCLEKGWGKRGKVCELLVHPFMRTSKSDTNEEILRFLF